MTGQHKVELWRYENAIWRVVIGTTAAAFVSLLAAVCLASFEPAPRSGALWLAELSRAFTFADIAAVLFIYCVMLPLQLITGQRCSTVYDRGKWVPF